MLEMDEDRKTILAEVKRFVDREVIPVAADYEHKDEYPWDLVQKLRDMSMFAATVPEEYGGLGLDYTTYALIVEELSRGWMSLAGILNTHVITAFLLKTFGTAEQKERILPVMAEGEKRGVLCITEPNAGSDVQAIQTTAVRDGDDYIVNGTKMFVTNGRHGTFYSLVVKTDKTANPPHKGMSILLFERTGNDPGFQVSRSFDKLGYKGVETVELVFENVRVPAANLLGGVEGHGFRHVMSALEVGRINVAARAVGVARAAFEDSIRYSQQRKTMGVPICQHQAIQLKLAEMATKIEAARLLMLNAARKKDAGERADMEAGMAKFFATETAHDVSLDAMRILGGYGYVTEFNVERYYRDAPLMIVAEGTNEIQRLIIARQLLQRYAIED